MKQFLLVAMFISLLVVSGCAEMQPPALETSPLAMLTLDYQWEKRGYVDMMSGDLTIENKNPFDVKDIEISCTHFDKNGTKLDSNARKLYEILKAKSKNAFKDFNMGFIHPKVNSTSCQVMHASFLRNQQPS